MTVPATGRIPNSVATGKEAALFSLYTYLKAQFALVPASSYPNSVGPTIIDTVYEQKAVFPHIAIRDLGMGQMGSYGFKRETNLTGQGRKEQTLIEFKCEDMNSPSNTKAEQMVRRLRDQLKHALQNMVAPLDSSGNAFMPACPLLDPNNGSAATGNYVWHPGDEANAWTETFLPPRAETPNLWTYRITVKILWVWNFIASNPS